MSLATLFNVPNNEQTLLVFAFSNADHHRLIVSALAKKGKDVPLYPLDPIPLFNVTAWAQNHQQMHFDFTGALGIQGVDLTDINFNDPAQLSAWMELHANEHRQADQRLGLDQ